LWPDEPAWKVRFEFSKKSGYDENELWKVQNIPFQPGKQQDFYNYNNNRRNTNTVFAETDLNGIHLKVYPGNNSTMCRPIHSRRAASRFLRIRRRRAGCAWTSR
jgi:hypothetical protein